MFFWSCWKAHVTLEQCIQFLLCTYMYLRSIEDTLCSLQWLIWLYSHQLWEVLILQLDEYKTDPYFLQNFQSNMTVCLVIHLLFRSCELEIVLTVLQIKTKTISRSQTLQNAWIMKQTVLLLRKFWRKYGSVPYLFSCTMWHFIEKVEDRSAAQYTWKIK